MAEVGSAFVSVIPSARGFGRTLDSQIGGEVKSSGSRTGKAFGTAMKVGAAAAIGGAVLLAGFLKGALGEAREAQKVGALTNAVIKSTGGVANVTAKQVGTLATSISNKIGVDDEAIAAGENMLLTFTKVRNEVGKGNDIFNQATVAASDMAAAFGGDATSNSKMLGKALNDPIKGVSALTRVGVSFTQQQKNQIKAMQESGNLLGAQKIILGEVAKQTAGAAVSQATSAEKARVAMGNLQETVGSALLPVLDRLANVFTTSIAPAITSFVTGMQTGTGAGGAFAGVMSAIGSAVMVVGGFLARNLAAFAAFVGIIGTAVVVGRAYAVVQGLINIVMAANPIGLVVVAIAALVAGLIYAYKHSETFRNIVNAAFNAVRNVVASVIGWLGTWVPSVFARVVSLVRAYVNAYRTVVTTVFKVVKAVVTVAVNAMKVSVSVAFNAIKAVINTARAVISAAMSAVRTAFNLVKTAVGAMASAVRSKISDAVGFIKSIPGKARAALGNVGGILVNAGKSLIQGLISGITSKIGEAVQKVRDGLNKVKSMLPGSPIKSGPLVGWNNTGPTGPGGRLIGNLISGIDSQESALTASMTRLTSRISVPRLAVDASVGASGARAGASAGVVQNIYETTDARATAAESARRLAWAGVA